MTSVFVGLAILDTSFGMLAGIGLQVNEPRLNALSKSNGGRGGTHHRRLHGERLLDGNCDGNGLSVLEASLCRIEDNETYAVAATAEQSSEKTC